MLFITRVKMSLVLGSFYNKFFRYGMCKVVNGLSTFSCCTHIDIILFWRAGTSR